MTGRWLKKNSLKFMNKQQIKKLPSGIRKHIREEKARIRREFLSDEKRTEEIRVLYDRFISYRKKKSDTKNKKEAKPKKKSNKKNSPKKTKKTTKKKAKKSTQKKTKTKK